MPGHDDEPLIPLADVQRLALQPARPLPPVRVFVDDALGCVLATDVVVGEDVPPFANTAMDGYAVRAADTAGAPVELTVVDVIGAGRAPRIPVGPGEAIQIMTGAPIPPEPTASPSSSERNHSPAVRTVGPGSGSSTSSRPATICAPPAAISQPAR